MAELIIHRSNPGDIHIVIDDAAILKLFTDAAETKQKVEDMAATIIENQQTTAERVSEWCSAITKRVDTLWRVIIAGFVATIGLMTTAITVIDMLTR